jgi:hypothetical protein
MRSQVAAVLTARQVRSVAEIIEQERRIGDVVPLLPQPPGEHHAQK